MCRKSWNLRYRIPARRTAPADDAVRAPQDTRAARRRGTAFLFDESAARRVRADRQGSRPWPDCRGHADVGTQTHALTTCRSEQLVANGACRQLVWRVGGDAVTRHLYRRITPVGPRLARTRWARIRQRTQSLAPGLPCVLYCGRAGIQGQTSREPAARSRSCQFEIGSVGWAKGASRAVPTIHPQSHPEWWARFRLRSPSYGGRFCPPYASRCWREPLTPNPLRANSARLAPAKERGEGADFLGRDNST